MVLKSGIENFPHKSRWKRFLENPWIKSAVEVLFSVVVSNLAILLGVYVHLLLVSESEAGWVDAILEVMKKIGRAEITGYIFGFIAPATWIMVNNFRLWRHRGLLLFFLFIQIAIIALSGILFALSVADKLKNGPLADTSSMLFLGISLLVWYGTLVYEKCVIDTAGDQVGVPAPKKESGSDVLAVLRGK